MLAYARLVVGASHARSREGLTRGGEGTRLARTAARETGNKKVPRHQKKNGRDRKNWGSQWETRAKTKSKTETEKA